MTGITKETPFDALKQELDTSFNLYSCTSPFDMMGLVHGHDRLILAQDAVLKAEKENQARSVPATPGTDPTQGPQ